MGMVFDGFQAGPAEMFPPPAGAQIPGDAEKITADRTPRARRGFRELEEDLLHEIAGFLGASMPPQEIPLQITRALPEQAVEVGGCGCGMGGIHGSGGPARTRSLPTHVALFREKVHGKSKESPRAKSSGFLRGRDSINEKGARASRHVVGNSWTSSVPMARDSRLAAHPEAAAGLAADQVYSVGFSACSRAGSSCKVRNMGNWVFLPRSETWSTRVLARKSLKKFCFPSCLLALSMRSNSSEVTK